mgnify:CR=1 FL=1
MQLFYNPTIENDLILEKEENTHAIKVLRKQTGDIVHIINGNGDLFECELTQIGNKKSHVSIVSKTTTAKKNNLHIAIAPTKNNNRIEFFLEKATEIGISEITPLLCDRSERKVLKNERMEKIILSAAKQSKNLWIPKLNPMQSLDSFLNQEKGNQKFIAHCEEEEEKGNLLTYDINKSDPCIILIGPEGDFTKKEIEKAKKNDFNELSLGKSRLRTETAAIVACTHYNLIE